MNKVVTLTDRWEAMSPVEQETVKQLHTLLRELKDKTPEQLKRMKGQVDVVQWVEYIEYTLQGLWRFSLDRDFHTHWKDLQGCTCPKLDNMMGAPYRITNLGCPHHTAEAPF